MDRALRRAAGLSLAWLASAAALAQPVPAMQTWHPWQLDSVLVVWALRQLPGPGLVFESVLRGTPIAAERAIDTPDSPYRRTGHRTAFEEAVRRNAISHPCVQRLRDAVRVVELAPWRKPEFPEVEAFEARVLKVIPTQPTRDGLDAALAEVDRYCREQQ
ncbi:MAG: hypothetical protein ABIN96_17325 [Rubrivivax sp.]